MNKIYCIHDRTFKRSMSHIQAARDFFEYYLPKEWQSMIDFNSLKLSKNTFIDRDLDKYESDVLYEVNIKGKPGYLLCEHQSKVDSMMPMRVWGYMIKIWEEHAQQTKDNSLPLIFPIVFYNGKIPYNGPRNLKAMLNGPIDLINKILYGDFHLIDTNKIRDEDLFDKGWVGPMTYTFKHAYDKNIPILQRKSIEMFKRLESEPNGLSFSEMLLVYLLRNAESTGGSIKNFIKAIQTELSLPKEGEFMSMAQQLWQEGRQEGRQEGIEIGQAQTLKATAIKMLKQQIDITIIENVTGLSVEQITALQKLETAEFV